MSCPTFTAERIAARLARADQPQELEPIWFMLLHGAAERAFDMVAFWHLWDCLTTLQRALPWTPTTDPARIEHTVRYGEDVPAYELQAGDRVVIRTDPAVVWALEADPFLLGDDPVLPVAVLRFADDRCLTVPDDHRFLIPELYRQRRTVMSERIGYLIPSGDFFVVHCPDCATNIETPVYRENVAGYRQTCKACGRLLAGPADADWPELFDGKRR